MPTLSDLLDFSQQSPYREYQSRQLRDGPGVDQQQLAEGRNFDYARQFLNEHPRFGAAALPLMIPADYTAQMMGILPERNYEPDLNQVGAGFKGYATGLADILRRKGY